MERTGKANGGKVEWSVRREDTGEIYIVADSRDWEYSQSLWLTDEEAKAYAEAILAVCVEGRAEQAQLCQKCRLYPVAAGEVCFCTFCARPDHI